MGAVAADGAAVRGRPGSDGFLVQDREPGSAGIGMAWLFAAAGHAFWRRGYPRLAFALISSHSSSCAILLSDTAGLSRGGRQFSPAGRQLRTFRSMARARLEGLLQLRHRATGPDPLCLFRLCHDRRADLRCTGCSGMVSKLCSSAAIYAGLYADRCHHHRHFSVAAGDRHLSGIRHFRRHFALQGQRLPGSGR